MLSTELYTNPSFAIVLTFDIIIIFNIQCLKWTKKWLTKLICMIDKPDRLCQRSSSASWLVECARTENKINSIYKKILTEIGKIENKGKPKFCNFKLENQGDKTVLLQNPFPRFKVS
jgi:hypothetical protein